MAGEPVKPHILDVTSKLGIGSIVAALITGSVTLSVTYCHRPRADMQSAARTAEASLPAATVQTVPAATGPSSAPIQEAAAHQTALPPAQPATPAAAVQVLSTAAIAVLSAPDGDSSKLFEIPGGRIFLALPLGGNGNWVQVNFEGQTGYARRGQGYASAN